MPVLSFHLSIKKKLEEVPVQLHPEEYPLTPWHGGQSRTWLDAQALWMFNYLIRW